MWSVTTGGDARTYLPLGRGNSIGGCGEAAPSNQPFERTLPGAVPTSRRLPTLAVNPSFRPPESSTAKVGSLLERGAIFFAWWGAAQLNR